MIGFTAPPVMFGRGVISTRFDTVGATEASDGTIVFVRALAGTLQTKTVLCVAKRKHGKWGPPQVAPFSGLDSDFSPQFTPDGQRLLFISNREHNHRFSVYSVSWKAGRWGIPSKMADSVNVSGNQLCASLSATGNLYVCSTREGAGSLYAIAKSGAAHPIDVINRVGYIADACVAKDESFLVFSAIGGKDELLAPGAVYQRGDLYVSFQNNGEWSQPRHLPKPINTSAAESSPTLSPDGKFLLFASDRGFMTDPQTRRLTYESLVRNMTTERNNLTKIYRMPLSDLLRTARRSPRAE